MKRTSILILFTFLMIPGLSACSLVQRHPNSGYAQSGIAHTDNSPYHHRQRHMESEARSELGLYGQGGPQHQQAIENRMHLNRLERSLETQREKRQYYQYKPLMRSDIERIHFLRLPSVEARERWAQSRDLKPGSREYGEEVNLAIENKDVVVGMSQEAVVQSWGDPDQVEIAGNPVYGNERWVYSRFVSANGGYERQNRILYFEAGHLIGWETL